MHSSTTFLFGVTAVLQAVSAVPTIIRTQSAATIPGSWIARIQDDEALDSVLSTVLDTAGIESKSNYTIGSVKGFSFDGDDAVLDMLQSVGAIKHVEPDFTVYANVPIAKQDSYSAPFANGSLVSQNGSTWGLARLSHSEPGAKSYVYDASAGQDTYIYVIDTGINVEHDDFGGRATLGKSFIKGSDGEDDQGHGSHCSGIAAGTKYGVAKKANLIAVKVLGADGSGSNSGVLKGIDWAVQNAKDNGHIARTVLSMSLGGPFSQVTNDAITEAVAEGAFVAVAAGNENEDASTSSPASAPEACTVGATTDEDVRAEFSNYGELVDIFAPGQDITSAWIGSSKATNTISGTSMACPQIAGLAAYLIALEGEKTPRELCSRIQELALKDVIQDAGNGSPNLLANNGNL
ncbi:related to Cuticle-degrading protease [Ramularia collo-cygni]|uniref:Related to Cuticle-degrading protease n=1 Tax=Ramularia collo-cygni TaxID=112498 RepID=A0A2D3V419_9PEZI|nr:related to Cuticle-degrading protease [Ramularia collo-cygni]CZT16249.1 related to Cuticle-degrading protease [Ramularia collo-cygni]